MKTFRPIVFGTAALLLSLAGVAKADAPATDEALKAEIASLKARLGEVENKQSTDWLDARRAEEVKALVREVLSDADTRASLQNDGLTAGYKDKFFLASQDGTFRLNIGGQIQVRYIFNTRNDPGATGGGNAASADADEAGFQIRRTKLFLDGYIGSPKINYRLQLAADRNTNGLGVEIAYTSYAVTDQFTLGGGRFKDGFLRESMVQDQKQLTIERSTIDATFGNSYTEGIQAVWTPVEPLKITASFNDGANAGNVNGTNDFQNDATNYGATARVDWKVAGDWKQADDFSAWSGGETALFLGAAATYQEGETGDRQTSTIYDDRFKGTVDALFKTAGASVYGAFVVEEARVNQNAGAISNHTRENFGALVQAGYFIIPDKFEPYARYEWLNIDSDAGSPGAVNIFTFGANYYIKKHAAKLSLDVVWAPEALTAASTFGGNNSGTGQLADSTQNEDQVVIRAQFQLLF